MNLLLIKPSELQNGSVVLDDDRANHIIKNIKSKNGDTLRAGVVNGEVVSATIMEIDKRSVTLKFKAEETAPTAPQISLILALPRPKAFRRILFGAVSCGVKDIHIINTWRVEKSYWNSPYLSSDKIESYCLEALSQAKDTIMPRVQFHRFFTSFIEEIIPNLPSHRLRYIAHPY
ncbi:MAG: 16S rRNA (uracil(1498)-N(3))-methyltransferase [Denitrovibrio sp.]|nr:MAG: 16S rRNA (uracil(1498)-N(3))-methyltransferase [Denitrovibrio sp.]